MAEDPRDFLERKNYEEHSTGPEKLCKTRPTGVEGLHNLGMLDARKIESDTVRDNDEAIQMA